MSGETVSLQVRVAVPSDEPAIYRLLIHTSRLSVRAWPWEEHLGQETFLVALARDRLVGMLLALPDAGPTAWVRLGVLADDVAVGPWLDRSLSKLVRPLRCLGARLLAWADVGEWAGPALPARGFHRLTRLVTMLKKSRWLPPVEVPGVGLRPAEATDVPALTRLDHAAFSPPWWMGEETLERLRQESLCFLLAERAGRCLGYVEARLVEDGAHIGRLAVAPEAQSCGVGGLLLADVLSCLWERGAEYVALNTQEENHSSQRLYARFGFHPLRRRVVVWARWL